MSSDDSENEGEGGSLRIVEVVGGKAAETAASSPDDEDQYKSAEEGEAGGEIEIVAEIAASPPPLPIETATEKV